MGLSFLCRSFAYLTVKDRLPTILTKVIDTIHRSKDKFFEEYGEVRTITDAQNLNDLKLYSGNMRVFSKLLVDN